MDVRRPVGQVLFHGHDDAPVRGAPSEALVVWLQAVDAESAITAQAAHNAWRYFWTTIMAFLSG
jgi:hypothetical protein